MRERSQIRRDGIDLAAGDGSPRTGSRRPLVGKARWSGDQRQKPDHTPASYTILNFPVQDVGAEVEELTG
ncbi:MAG TPA: hypothetical protein VES60_16105, partial [Nakamurella sp.]|nr:hypothetical protein [Nakamurella sp.]